MCMKDVDHGCAANARRPMMQRFELLRRDGRDTVCGQELWEYHLLIAAHSPVIWLTLPAAVYERTGHGPDGKGMLS
jgi:hypothetical protein